MRQQDILHLRVTFVGSGLFLRPLRLGGGQPILAISRLGRQPIACGI